MKSELVRAVGQISAERKLPEDAVTSAIEDALAVVYRRDPEANGQDVRVKIELRNGEVTVNTVRRVVDDAEFDKIEDDIDAHIKLSDALKADKAIRIGDDLLTGELPYQSGRTMASTTRQLIMQNLREAERNLAFGQFKDREHKLLDGVISRVEQRNVLVNAGNSITIMPSHEQPPNERYRAGQKMKFFVAKVGRGLKGPEVILSRSHPDLLRVLFEMEVPEIKDGTVEIKAIAREAGSRSKIAVYSSDEKVDPVGTCIGLRGIRIQNVVNELMGEKVDVIEWSEDIEKFVVNSLNPATVLSVEIDEENTAAKAYVADHGLSLAIGRDGQNVRLAAKLTNWTIDILSVSESASPPTKDATSAAASAPATKAAKSKATAKKAPAKAKTKKAKSATAKSSGKANLKNLEEELKNLTEQEPDVAAEPVESAPVDTLDFEADNLFGTAPSEASKIRFAEDIGEVRKRRSGDNDTQPTKRKKKRTPK